MLQNQEKPAEEHAEQNLRLTMENGEVVKVERDQAAEVTFMAGFSVLSGSAVCIHPETGKPQAILPAVYVRLLGHPDDRDEKLVEEEGAKAFDFRLLCNPVSTLGLYCRLKDYFEELGVDTSNPQAYFDQIDEMVVEAADRLNS